MRDIRSLFAPIQGREVKFEIHYYNYVVMDAAIVQSV
jgi:hypothetical protein